MSLVIERHGLLATLQDSGRFGVRHLGVGQGGGADWISQCWANWLLGNPLDAAVIEITLGGFSLVAEQDCCLALADDKAAPRWSAKASAACTVTAGRWPLAST